ncbi:MAG TPA: class I tRNA ligase family protein, partial [Kofleriaceae bacterium]|nr:class I tRNA ligase family protein [Kofleriaceae bacterium]
CGKITVARVDPTQCDACGSDQLRQDPDILDTWFSSALWPFSTLGWPDKTRDLATFYPNNVLVTGPDIIFFWVARMMMMGLHFMGKVPFRTVYLTSIITDDNGAKMSKTKGNGIDPLDVVHGATLDQLLERIDIEKPPVDLEALKRTVRKNFAKGVPAMGADALRFAFAALNTTLRIRLSVDRVEKYRNFINKLWNASRFALMNLDGYDPERFEAQLSTPAGRASLGMAERWILSRLQTVVGEVDSALETFRFNDAAGAIFHFVWDELCDWYIELAKPHLYMSAEDEQDAARNARRHVVQGVLATALETTMRLMHPFSPFVTEEIWQKLPKPPQLPGSLMITVFPRSDASWVDMEAEGEMRLLQEVAVACRMLKQTYGVSPAQSIDVELRVAGGERRSVIERHLAVIDRASKVAATVSADTAAPAPAGSAKAVVGGDVEIVMPLGGLIDVAAEKSRIAKEIAKAEKEISALEKKLGNAEFLARAPEDIVAEQRARLAEEQSRRQRLADALATLSSGGAAEGPA